MMRNLLRAALGAGAELGDAAADRHAFHTLEWELRSIERALAAALRDLTGVLALEIAEKRRIEAFGERIASDEDMALKAVAAGDERLALDIAARIAERHERRGEAETARLEYAERVRAMRSGIAAMEQRLARLRREFALLRAKAALQRVESVASDRGSLVAAGLAEAEATLARIKRQQQKHEDRFAAATAIAADREGGALDEGIRAAGLMPTPPLSAAAVLRQLCQRDGIAPPPATRTSVPITNSNAREC